MTTDAERAAVRQGWIQTTLILVGMVTTVLLAFSRLDAKADTAMATAVRAEVKASDVDQRTHEMKNELTAIRVLLDERLPNANAARPPK